jgi:hypothetical protein
MPDTQERTRRNWADLVVIMVSLFLLALTAWNAVAPERELASLGQLYATYGFGGALGLVSFFVAQRSRAIGRVLLAGAIVVVLALGLGAYREQSTGFWVTVVIPAVLLVAALPFLGPLPRQASGA